MPVNGDPGKMYIVPSGDHGLFLTKSDYPELAKKLGDTSSSPFIKIDARSTVGIGVRAKQEFNTRNATIGLLKADRAKEIEKLHFVPNTMVSSAGASDWWGGLSTAEQDRLIQDRQRQTSAP